MASKYVETLEKHQLLLTNTVLRLYRLIISGAHWPGDHLRLQPDGEPFIDDVLARLGVFAQDTKGYTEKYSGVDEAVPSRVSHAIAERTQSPISPLSSLSSTSNGSQITHTTPFPGSKTSPDPFGGDICETSSSFDVSQVAQGFINPLALHTLEDLPGENLALAYESEIENRNNCLFTEDPDLLLLKLNAYVITNCDPAVDMDWGLKMRSLICRLSVWRQSDKVVSNKLLSNLFDSQA